MCGPVRRSSGTPATSSANIAIAVSAATAGATLWTADAAHEQVAGAMSDLKLLLHRA